MTNVGGRPRTVSLPPEQMIQLGEEMIQWVLIHDPLHLSQWYSIEKMFTYAQFKQFCDKPEFAPYYEKALRIIGLKYLDKKSMVRDSVAHRWLKIYFPDLKAVEDEDARIRKGIAENEHANLAMIAKLAAEGKITQSETNVNKLQEMAS